jgi:hypothetical protein
MKFGYVMGRIVFYGLRVIWITQQLVIEMVLLAAIKLKGG